MRYFPTFAMFMKLAIISHTEHYHTADGTVVGWGPTITELNHLIKDFEMIYHLAFLHEGPPPESALPYASEAIVFVPMKPLGGTKMVDKMKLLTAMPSVLKNVADVLRQVDVFQFRAPTGIGVYTIPYLTYFANKPGWFKYAGNWQQQNPPFGYRIQRQLLKKQSKKVTINGRWENQPKHCLSFENPCLTQAERTEGNTVLMKKTYQPSFRFCFVGRLEDAKGVGRILEAFSKIKQSEKVTEIHFAGNGENFEKYKRFAEENNLPAVFHGFMHRDAVFDLYRSCDFFLLPSTASEGFPKAIAEAMNFGCIPIVSDISSIAQYVNDTNGVVLPKCDADALATAIDTLLSQDAEYLRHKAKVGYQAVADFTFAHYRSRIQNEIINCPTFLND